MDKYLNLKLKSNNKTLSIGEGSRYKLLSIEGLESSYYEVNITQNMQYDGGRVNNKRIVSRPISFIAEFTSVEEAESERQKLISFFNPTKSGILTANYGGTERIIGYELEGFKEKRTNLYEPLSFQVDLICPCPFWTDSYITREEINAWIGGQEYPFSFPVSFMTKGEPRQNIINTGDVNTPIEIIFRGTATNPKIMNVLTGEYIKVNKVLTSDDTLTINTTFGNKKVEIVNINGTTTDALNYIDLSSSFFELYVGDNILEYSSEGLAPSSVNIRYKNRYLGV